MPISAMQPGQLSLPVVPLGGSEGAGGGRAHQDGPGEAPGGRQMRLVHRAQDWTKNWEVRWLGVCGINTQQQVGAVTDNGSLVTCPKCRRIKARP